MRLSHRGNPLLEASLWKEKKIRIWILNRSLLINTCQPPISHWVQLPGCQPQVGGQVFGKVPSGAVTISLLSSQVYLANAELQTEGMEYPSAP